MNCPKCEGGTFLAEEEFVKLLENIEPVKAVIKAIYVCKSCAEKFSRIFYENLDGRMKPAESSAATTATASPEPAAEGIQFLDKV